MPDNIDKTQQEQTGVFPCDNPMSTTDDIFDSYSTDGLPDRAYAEYDDGKAERGAAITRPACRSGSSSE
jgi:hypothetical protein